jgi:hypothetical protein
MAGTRKKKDLLKSTITTNIAATAAKKINKTRKGRDQVTRVTSPIKVVDTQSRQWNRWSP